MTAKQKERLLEKIENRFYKIANECALGTPEYYYIFYAKDEIIALLKKEIKI